MDFAVHNDYNVSTKTNTNKNIFHFKINLHLLYDVVCITLLFISPFLFFILLIHACHSLFSHQYERELICVLALLGENTDKLLHFPC